MCKCDEEALHALFPDGVPKPSPEVIMYCVEAESTRRGLAYERSPDSGEK